MVNQQQHSHQQHYHHSQQKHSHNNAALTTMNVMMTSNSPTTTTTSSHGSNHTTITTSSSSSNSTISDKINNINCNNNNNCCIVGGSGGSTCRNHQQQQQTYQFMMNNIPNQTLSTILSDPKAFPSLSQFVQSTTSSDSFNTINSNNNHCNTIHSNNNTTFNNTMMQSSLNKYCKVQCNEQQSILLQRCPNNSEYNFIHEFGNDYISNNIIFKKFNGKDIENIFQIFKQNIKLKNRNCKTFVFEQCFDGHEAFILLQEILNSKFNFNDISISKLALHLGQYLLTIGKFNHVCKEHCFKNINLLLYQFGNANNSLQFNELKVTNSPNWYLIYPNIDCFIVQQSSNSVQLFVCHVPIIGEYSPILNGISIGELKDVLLCDVLPNEEGVEMLCRNDDLYLYTFIQKTKFQEYPDYITIQLLTVQSTIQKSTLAIYSRCKYGYSDWGNNKERVNSWISKIVSKCQQQPLRKVKLSSSSI